MLTRTLLVASASAAVVVGAAGCGTPSSQTAPTSTAAATVTASTQATSTEPAPSPVTVTITATTSAPPDAVPTRDPCQLLTPSLAKEYAGDDAERQTSLGDPPVPVEGGACYYESSAGSVLFSINPVPTDPDAPVNHFHVLTPGNEIPGLPFTAYRFGPGQSVVVVKNDLLLEFKVSNDEGVEANWNDDVELAELIVPQVG